MALTAAERAKRYREKLKQNPEKYENHKKKELQRLKKTQKKINELTDEEKNERRKKWREQKKRQKERQEEKRKPCLPNQQLSNMSNSVSRSFKVKYTSLSRRYKTAMKTIDKYKTTLNNIRKKFYRAQVKHEQEITKLQAEKDKLEARQELLEISIREAYSDCKKPADKQVVKKLAIKIGEKTEKAVDRKLLGLKGQIRLKTINKSIKRPTNKKIQSEIELFFNRDDISRSTSGKKETRTRNKTKMQIRYLVDTLLNLYHIYRAEGGKYSYATFFRYKPFYVLSPSSTNRNTCMCIKHSNIEFMFFALKLKGVIHHKNISELLKDVACDTKSMKCMYNICKECETPHIQYDRMKVQDDLTWNKWVRGDHKYEKSGQVHVTKKTTKQQMKGNLTELITEFEKQLKLFKTHVYNWSEQHRQFRECVTKLTDEEIVILCDFSENFDCKYSNEIQSMHFGASKNAITLHTGVIFGQDFSQSFVTVCDDNCHEPNAIWAHLLPVIKKSKEMNPNIKIIHYFSDGPSSQYRQKKNFFLLNLFTQKLKLSYATWSFSEAGHGKSMADGIGGSVKRQLDRRVLYGEDITNATDAHRVLQTTMKSVTSYYISPDDVKNIKKLIPENICAVRGTMQLHQVISSRPNQIEHRRLSCFCGKMRGLCGCHGPKTHILVPVPVSTEETFVTDHSYTYTGIEEDLFDFPIYLEEEITIPSNPENQDSFERVLPIENDFMNDFTYQMTLKPPVETPNQPKRVKILKPTTNDLRPTSEGNFSAKRARILLPSRENQLALAPNNSKSRSSSRTFPCHVCKTRHPFILQRMVTCMVCNNWVCFSCSGTTFFDYVCPTCLTSNN